jgi:hypothetical protein
MLTLTLQKLRMPEIQGAKGEAIPIHRDWRCGIIPPKAGRVNNGPIKATISPEVIFSTSLKTATTG